ncbi:MAG: hypothetical protein AB200_01615 [Parcubacteria bacterium C7867-005]|nr:MAG: hypothetical protein AB200_01615 [Parcubacteria bacterium C7867-005]
MKTIITHSGAFHADDVFAVATLLLVYSDAEVVRSRNEEIINNGDIVVDVGGVYDPKKMRFDHHQPGGAGSRPNGIPYASFGLVWKEYGEQLSGIEEKKIIDSLLASPIDALDNGVDISESIFEGIREFSVRDFLYSYVDNSKSDEGYLSQTFLTVVAVAKDLLQREIIRAREVVGGMKKVQSIVDGMDDKRIVVLDEDLPWGNVLSKIKEPMYVVYPRKEGNWGVRAVRDNINGFDMRKPLPLDWAGKTGESLVESTGIADAVFCHNKRFLIAAKSKEGAIKLAHIALNS